MVDWKKITESEWYRTWVYKPYKSCTYSSVQEMLDRDETHGFLYEIWFSIKCAIFRVWNWPGDRIADLRCYHQRGIHGIAESDCWGLYHHLTDINLRGLRYIKEHKQGCPVLEGYDLDGSEAEFDKMSREWDRILDDMIYTFETMEKIENHTILAPNVAADYFTDEEVVKWTKFCQDSSFSLAQYVITREEFERYKRGWDYYRKYFFSLWD